jgi:hypothetical protein
LSQYSSQKPKSLPPIRPADSIISSQLLPCDLNQSTEGPRLSPYLFKFRALISASLSGGVYALNCSPIARRFACIALAICSESTPAARSELPMSRSSETASA